MKIIKLEVENFKKLTAVEITPMDNIIFITGENGAGKSSVLDAITVALCGSREIPAVPVKKGADKGKIVIDLGDHTVTRSFTKDNSYLKIESKDGSKIASPQAFLDKIVGNVSFDPLDFLNNEKLKQRNILLQLLGVDVDNLDKKERSLRDERTIIGRDVERFKAVYQNEIYYPEVKTITELNISDLSVKLKDAMDLNLAIERETTYNENLKIMAKRDIERLELVARQVETLLKEKQDLEESIQKRKEQYTITRNRLAQAVLINTGEIEKEMVNVESVNQKIRANLKKAETEFQLNQTKSQCDNLTHQIELISQERKDILINATMPVVGLSFDDNGLLYNSVPLDQCSDGEKLMVSLGISMALNPTLRVLRIKDGSLLDVRNREIIKSMVAEKDYQLWFESVGSDGKVGIYIEEGEIVLVDGQEVKKSTSSKEKVQEKGKSESNILSTGNLCSKVLSNPEDEW